MGMKYSTNIKSTIPEKRKVFFSKRDGTVFTVIIRGRGQLAVLAVIYS